MIVEALVALLSLDVEWFIYIIFANLLWVFALLAIAYIYWTGKKAFSGFLIIVFGLWVLSDFVSVTGWVWAVGAFLMVLYISRVALLVFVSEIKWLEPHLPKIYCVQFLVLLVIFNIFIFG